VTEAELIVNNNLNRATGQGLPKGFVLVRKMKSARANADQA
jgi:hypothetical protein